MEENVDVRIEETAQGWWNFRVVARWKHIAHIADRHSHTIHEVFYTPEGKIDSWFERPADMEGEDEEELKNKLAMMVSAFAKPVLNYEDIEHLKE